MIQAGVADDDPESIALDARIDARDDYLYEQFGKPHYDQHYGKHYGKWIAILIDGRILIAQSASELTWKADCEFGPGEYSKRKLAEFPGHEILY